MTDYSCTTRHPVDAKIKSSIFHYLLSITVFGFLFFCTPSATKLQYEILETFLTANCQRDKTFQNFWKDKPKNESVLDFKLKRLESQMKNVYQKVVTYRRVAL